jgi:hypothetical protein
MQYSDLISQLNNDVLINQPINNPQGQLQAGNIDIYNRPKVKNKDGTISTVRSMSFSPQQGTEVLIPTVVGDRVLSEEDAIKNYFKTKQHLGMFNTPENASTYAQNLHLQQRNLYGD